MRTTLLALAVLALTGCGPGYQEQFRNQSSVTYWYDPARQNMGTMQGRAQQYCDQQGRDALPQAQSGDPYSGISISFVCRPRG